MAILDTVTGASSAYSLRKLRDSYSGKCIRARRSSDNDEQDIAFDSNGKLATNSLIEDGATTFSSWYGSDSVYVVRWYDQSGNGHNASQSTTNRQPLIVTDGILNTGITFSTSGNALSIGNHADFRTPTMSILAINKPSDSSLIRYVISKSSTLYCWGMQANTFEFLDLWGSTVVRLDGDSNWGAGNTYLQSIVVNKSTSASLYYNGALTDTENFGESINNWDHTLGANIEIGRRPDGHLPFGGLIYEIVYFKTELSDTNRKLIESEQGIYYGITIEGGGTNAEITATIGSATAEGITASITAVISQNVAGIIGATTAEGLTASITAIRVVNITSDVGNAIGAGLTATIANQSIPVNVRYSFTVPKKNLAFYGGVPKQNLTFYV